MSFECPRCGLDVSEDYYGPCSTCRETLREVVRPDELKVKAFFKGGGKFDTIPDSRVYGQ